MPHDGVQVDQVVSGTYLTDRDSCDFYSEFTIRNTIGEDLYFARADGEIFTVPASTLSRVQDPHVEIRILVRAGRPDPSQRTLHGSPSYAKMKLPTKVITIDYDRLLSGVVFIPELGTSCALGKHISSLRESNYLSDAYKTRLIEETSQHFLSNYATPIVVYGNTHDVSLPYLYLEINERLTSVVLDHRLDLPEKLIISINRGGKYDAYEIREKDLDWKNSSAWETTIEGTSWIFGTDRAAVQKKITARKNKSLSRRTDEEVNELIEQRTAELKRDVETRDQQISQLQKELKLVKDELQNTKTELNKANSYSQASYEQQVLAAKLAAQQQEQQNLKEKQELLREQERLQRERDALKFEYEKRINEAKVRKEDLSVKSSEASTWATIAKSIAIILPAVISVVSIVIAQRKTKDT